MIDRTIMGLQDQSSNFPVTNQNIIAGRLTKQNYLN